MSTSTSVKNRLKQFEQDTEMERPTAPPKPLNPALQRFMKKQDEVSKENKPTLNQTKPKPFSDSFSSSQSNKEHTASTTSLKFNGSTNQQKADVNQNVFPKPVQSSVLAASVISAAANKVSSESNKIKENDKFGNLKKPVTSSISSSSTGSSSSSSSLSSPRSFRPQTPPKPPAKFDKAPSEAGVKLPLIPKLPVSNKPPSFVSPSIQSKKQQISSPNGVSETEKLSATIDSSENNYDKTIPSAEEGKERLSFQNLCKGFQGTSNSCSTEHSGNISYSDKKSRVSTDTESSSLESKYRRISDVIAERSSDGKKFKKAKLTDLPDLGKKPEKPQLPMDNIDLGSLLNQYQNAVKELGRTSNAAPVSSIDDEDDGDIYEDGFSVANDPILRETSTKRKSEVVSEIPEMTEEEEEADNLYDDGQSMPTTCEADVYDDGQSMPVSVQGTEEISAVDDSIQESMDDVYEDEESMAVITERIKKERAEEESEQDRKNRIKKEEDRKKKEEKERKEKEREEERKKKKEEKERLMKEKAEKKLRDRFKLTGDEIPVGEGTIIQDTKGKGDNLQVKKGQLATIVRIDKNPANKWLIRIDDSMGYVESSNIEINPSIIKETMVKKRKESSLASLTPSESTDGLLYDDVPPEDDGDVYEAFD